MGMAIPNRTRKEIPSQIAILRKRLSVLWFTVIGFDSFKKADGKAIRFQLHSQNIEEESEILNECLLSQCISKPIDRQGNYAVTLAVIGLEHIENVVCSTYHMVSSSVSRE